MFINNIAKKGERNILIKNFHCTFHTLTIYSEFLQIGTYKGRKDPGIPSVGVEIMELKTMVEKK